MARVAVAAKNANPAENLTTFLTRQCTISGMNTIEFTPFTPEQINQQFAAIAAELGALSLADRPVIAIGGEGGNDHLRFGGENDNGFHVGGEGSEK